MLRHTLLLLFLYGIKSSTGRPGSDVAEARHDEPHHSDGFKESDGVGAGTESTLGPGSAVRDPEKTPLANFLNHVMATAGPGSPVAVSPPFGVSATSPILHLNRTRTEVFPAEAVVVTTYNRDGSPRASVAHFRPLSAQSPPAGVPRIPWPFAGVFPIVVNDPFLAAYNSLYGGFTSVVEYGPEADICRGNKKESISARTSTATTEETFPEVRLGAEIKLVRSGRSRRDTTGITMQFKNGDRVDLEVGDPDSGNVFVPAEAEERTRAHSVMLVNPPPLSSIPRPHNPGFNVKKKKPQRPDKEGEGTSEEVGEETEDTTSQSGTGGGDGVAISPPPDGASVAEAKPVGLAIAGPGGVAAAKPQGTAVAGPGGLAIARPIGTAIAGVEVEGTVPIGGQNKKNKKKPKQDPEKMDDETDSELHYVGGLTGPIGNPQPNTKDFGKVKSRSQGNLLGDDVHRVKLGEQNGKYGFLPVQAKISGERLQKRMDTPTFFHGLLGSRSAPPLVHQAQQPNQMFPQNYYY